MLRQVFSEIAGVATNPDQLGRIIDTVRTREVRFATPLVPAIRLSDLRCLFIPSFKAAPQGFFYKLGQRKLVCFPFTHNLSRHRRRRLHRHSHFHNALAMAACYRSHSPL